MIAYPAQLPFISKRLNINVSQLLHAIQHNMRTVLLTNALPAIAPVRHAVEHSVQIACHVLHRCILIR